MNSHIIRLILIKTREAGCKGKSIQETNVEKIKSGAFGTTNEAINYTYEVIAIDDHGDVILY